MKTSELHTRLVSCTPITGKLLFSTLVLRMPSSSINSPHNENQPRVKQHLSDTRLSKTQVVSSSTVQAVSSSVDLAHGKAFSHCLVYEKLLLQTHSFPRDVSILSESVWTSFKQHTARSHVLKIVSTKPCSIIKSSNTMLKASSGKMQFSFCQYPSAP